MVILFSIANGRAPYQHAAVLLSITIVIIRWYQKERHARHLARVEVIMVADFASVHLGNTRPLHIHFPPGYHTSAQAYKTLYLNDGQDREALKLQETLANLYTRQLIEPIVVVAIPTNEERLHEYGTAVVANDKGLGANATDYARFVIEEVMPYVKQNYRVQGGAENTAVLGASLGGLSAFDLAWNYPDKFGIVGVMSGSFWWWTQGLETEDDQDGRIAHAMVRTGPKRERQRFWFQAATHDEFSDRDENGVIDAIQDTQELIDELVALGYERGKDVVYMEVRGGRHNYDTWADVFPQFLQWAFPAH